MDSDKARPPKRRRGVWGEAIRDSFLALLGESGNARAALRIVGHPNMFYKRRRRDPAFAADWAAAVEAVDARLRQAQSPFLGPIEVKSMPPDDSGRPDADALGGLLKPGRKRPQRRPEPVIRRTSNGRLQLTLARDGHWTSEIEADFLARLRATGNFSASARAVGFQPASVIERTRKWAAFARACEEALEDASVALDYALVAYAHALLRAPGEPPDQEEEVGFDPERAIRILAFLDSRRQGRTGRGRRKGPPGRTFEQACESILGKIEAIERHEARNKAREGKDGDGR
jgi:hypothetical protein